MRWRNLRLDWGYAIGELIIVTAGVFIALAINQWNDGRLERAEEADAISGILGDIEEDLRFFSFTMNGVTEKEESLQRVGAALANGVPGDPRAFLTDLVVGTLFGWSQGLASRSTYDDLLASGRLEVIRDSGIRQQVAAYYRNYESDSDRINERETEYPNITYRLVPRAIVEDTDMDSVSDTAVQSDLTDEQLRGLVARVKQTEIGNYVTGEINFAEFIRAITLRRQQRAMTLVRLLEDYGLREESKH